MKGISTNRNVSDIVSCLSGAGVEFVGRYYGGSISKRLTVAEATAISGAGMSIIVFYQEYNNQLSLFSGAVGTAQAQRALAAAQALGQAAGSSIYFAVDFETDQDAVNGPIRDYFQAINDAFSAAGSPYRVGVYGSGLTCQTLKSLGLVSFTCISDSRGFAGTPEFTQSGQWDILQSLATVSLCGFAPGVEGDYEDCEAHDGQDYGAFSFRPAAAAWTLTVGDNTDAIACRLVDNSAYVPLRQLFTHVFGDAETSQFLGFDGTQATWQGQPLPFPGTVIDGVDYVPVRPVASYLGLIVTVTGTSIQLTRPPAQGS
jgi:hypothetical protein